VLVLPTRQQGKTLLEAVVAGLPGEAREVCIQQAPAALLGEALHEGETLRELEEEREDERVSPDAGFENSIRNQQARGPPGRPGPRQVAAARPPRKRPSTAASPREPSNVARYFCQAIS